MTKTELINFKNKVIGVRLDAIDHLILRAAMDSLNASAADVFRLALSNYAKNLGIETDRATLAARLRNGDDQ